MVAMGGKPLKKKEEKKKNAKKEAMRFRCRKTRGFSCAAPLTSLTPPPLQLQ
jgi:hypothetical protein